jgi:lysophospholipase L1-like esterase
MKHINNGSGKDARTWQPFVILAVFIGIIWGLSGLAGGAEAAEAGALQHNRAYLPVMIKEQPLFPTHTPTPQQAPSPTPTTHPGCPAGMVSCWRFEESGTVLADSAGPNPASCTGSACPERVAGMVGGARSFDGVDDTLTVPHHPSLVWGGGQSFTVVTWVKVEADCTGNRVFLGKPKDPTGYAAWWLGCADGSSAAAFYLRDSNQNSLTLKGSRRLNDGEWHHVVGVRDKDSGAVRLYVDGKLEAAQPAAFTGNFASLQPLTFGSLAGRYFARAVLDEAAIYTRPLSEVNIRAHYFLARPYCQVCSTPVRIMPLGDSITLGSGPPPPYNGYRRPLYHGLSQVYPIDFVGGQFNGDPDFDRNHEGHGGWHAAGHDSRSILVNTYAWLEANPTDVVLLHIGTNDINDGGQSAVEVAAILDEIDRFDEKITVILALIINRQTYSAVTSQYNQDLRNMAEQRIARGDKIILVDMETALQYPEDMIDLLHPNTSGYAKMAEQWRQTLATFLPVCP